MVIRKILHNQKGFTLTELLVVVCLLAILSGFFLHSFLFAISQFQNRMALLELEDNLAIASEYIASDGINSLSVKNCNTDSLTLQMENAAVSYTLDNDLQAKEHLYNLKGKILYRRESTQVNRQPMANFISDFYVYYYDSNGDITYDPDCVCIIDAELRGQWNETVVQKRQMIRLRNSDYL